MSERCIHEDVKNICAHPERRRTGKMVAILGDRPACVLLMNDAQCPYRWVPDASAADTIWSRLAQD